MKRPKNTVRKNIQRIIDKNNMVKAHVSAALGIRPSYLNEKLSGKFTFTLYEVEEFMAFAKCSPLDIFGAV